MVAGDMSRDKIPISHFVCWLIVFADRSHLL